MAGEQVVSKPRTLSPETSFPNTGPSSWSSIHHHSVITHSFIPATIFLDASSVPGPMRQPLGVPGRTRRQHSEGTRGRGGLPPEASRQPSQPKAPGATPFPSLRPRPLTVRSGGSPRGGDYGPTGARRPRARAYPPPKPEKQWRGR